ncbi:MAG: hypothetical protein A2527_07315 [Candidatus Lambdaproteobacteria bacterium RIFOXYD2_FULL_50_16]|uniref:NYN domain-containing protein n=1 Tax=Candidatus Lambdaproteobacteria bacterium RIFOXYD2_FULL_50_16 TaxID=1817772 RepID=A0A1F6GB59_9PROT|nr:MAG: hypothetical protein A2527_07315 [Candidatus Lambdaproteobacteria bacterium RIFOXYD2_FULL_50_16]
MAIDTIAYVDGFNLYFGALKDTPYKWLDLHQAISSRLGPDFNLIGLKYFTAMVIPTTNNPKVLERQNTYLRALSATQPNFTLIKGKYKLREIVRPKLALARWPQDSHPIAPEDYEKIPGYVWVSSWEEKGSDVNLAIQIVADAAKNHSKAICLISNDSDIAGALQIAKNDFQKKIVLLTPWKYRQKIPNELKAPADLLRVLNEVTLKDSQLPDQIEGTPLSKPLAW